MIEDDDSHDFPYSANYTDGVSYHDALNGAYGGNFNGNFSVSQGNIENTTLATFTKSGTVVRSDLYQMAPSGAPNPPAGIWLGYFELNTNGAMNYVAFPTSKPSLQPSTIRAHGHHHLQDRPLWHLQSSGTNNISALLSTWPVIGGNL